MENIEKYSKNNRVPGRFYTGADSGSSERNYYHDQPGFPRDHRLLCLPLQLPAVTRTGEEGGRRFQPLPSNFGGCLPPAHRRSTAGDALFIYLRAGGAACSNRNIEFVHYKQKILESAAELFEKSILMLRLLSRDVATILSHLADVYEEQGRRDEA